MITSETVLFVVICALIYACALLALQSHARKLKYEDVRDEWLRAEKVAHELKAQNEMLSFDRDATGWMLYTVMRSLPEGHELNLFESKEYLKTIVAKE